jgi:hypothetical protein
LFAVNAEEFEIRRLLADLERECHGNLRLGENAGIS